MKITRGEITITDVPGVEYIKLDTRANVATIKFSYFEHAVAYQRDRLADLRDALNVALLELTEANNAAVDETVGKPTPSVKIGDMFTDESEPAGIATIEDSEGDTWVRTGDGMYSYSDPGTGELWRTWRGVLRMHGPVTVISVNQ